ncbi:hypothetical protein M378DRAFT_25948 [Amanita muscaria Koide BX008]|uniref:Uncharacterized protein n=1 Tax=Amanita muscaria (strain Koide BX008) TaxID=946122 RepID=A0A0C2SFA4_AMAMK|nr:hypothetical protein M378DRAFT_25948 [Amanita muscaria Koide BX008]
MSKINYCYKNCVSSGGSECGWRSSHHHTFSVHSSFPPFTILKYSDSMDASF